MITIQLRIRTLLGLIALVGLTIGCGSGKTSEKDASVGVDSSPVDASNTKLGEPCTTSSECGPGGYCVDGSTGDTCTYACDEGCPAGWNCRIKEVGSDLVSVCVPPQYDFCKACTDTQQCNGGVCVSLDGTAACLASCPVEGSCPNGYTCDDDPTGQNPGKFCIPNTGNCSCTEAEKGQIRTCSNTNASGTCRGVETCNPDTGGWGGCDAPAASAETCDGMDNNCNQLIDDGVGGSACAITNGFGSCPGTTLCTGANGAICQGKTPEAETCNSTDDNCNGAVDESWPQLSSVCSAGIGGCERFGVVRCTADGSGTECSVTAGAPIAEKCNNLDDDCDTRTDETFPSLGTTCSTGVGVCARQGNQVCDASGSGTQCSVTPGTPNASEACNNLDDDCDAKTDEGFRNQGTGQYDQNTACGSCTTDCTQLFDLPNASGTCSTVSGSPRCDMACEPDAFDLDGSPATGCELRLDTGGIYVSVDDPASADDATCGLGPVGTGGGHHPCLSIAQGIARANATNRPRVLVANGSYNEAVTITNGRSLLGAHSPDTWERDVTATGTLITGTAPVPSSNHDRTVLASGITTPTTFEGFIVLGPVNPKVGGNSYAIYVSASSTNFRIVSNTIFGGRGGPGADGTSGAAGTIGVNGVGRSSNPSGYDAKVASAGLGQCNAVNNRIYINGGSLSCGTDNVSGGSGGGNRCQPAADNTEYSGIDGITGQAGAPVLGGPAGSGADAGDDSTLVAGGSLCQVPTIDYGLDGVNGVNGNHGPATSGCSAAAASGAVVGGHWVGGIGPAGTTGGNGGGGGGGGAGGGSFCASCAELKDRLGGHGGGGGSGGCGGFGGASAAPGGGVFAIFIVGGSAPVVLSNQLFRGEGGVGGAGGAAGAGGPGGVGAGGGTSTLFCAGPAGRGGNGGDGGHGSGGGGACGGSSFGIFGSGIGSPTYCDPAAGNTISSGAGGSGGQGGYSVVNAGAAGTAGALATCTFN